MNETIEHKTVHAAERVSDTPDLAFDVATFAPMVHRKCACGGNAGPDGGCEKCDVALPQPVAATEAPYSLSGHDAGTVAGDRKDGVVHGPAGGANHWTDCPTSWQPRANAAQMVGASWVDNVVNGLSNLPTPIPPAVATLLQKHFHTTLDKDIGKILGRYKQIQTAIHSSLNFECETSCDPNVLAYVYSIWTHLHLCPYWFNSTADLQAATVVHEISHDVVGADDNAYEWQTGKYNAMSVADAMSNADSFAHFAWDASKSTPPTPPPTPPSSTKPGGP